VPCLVLACWRLRPAYRKQLPGETRSSRSAAWRPPVGNQPLRWKERYLGERSPLLRPLAGLAGRALVAACTLGVYGGLAVHTWINGPDPAYSQIVLVLGLAVLAVAAVLVAVRAAGSVAAERERQTWETLLLTPLKPRVLLRGKLWGALDMAWPYLATYLGAALGPVLVLGFWATIWLVLTWLATWIVLYFTAATGLECSVRTGASWRALVRALLGSTWVAGQRFLTFGLPAGFLTGMVGFALLGAMPLGLERGFALGSLLATVAVLLAQAEANLEEAEHWIDHNERIPQAQMRSRRTEGMVARKAAAGEKATSAFPRA
jgi:hypothetical protein